MTKNRTKETAEVTRVFVYGTLKNGFNNNCIIQDLHDKCEKAQMPNATMCADQPGFPVVCALPISEFLNGHECVGNVHDEFADHVTGELYTFSGHNAAKAIQNMDRLEGCQNPNKHSKNTGNFYDRIKATIINSDGEEVEAWVYVSPIRSERSHRYIIPDGAWDHSFHAVPNPLLQTYDYD